MLLNNSAKSNQGLITGMADSLAERCFQKHRPLTESKPNANAASVPLTTRSRSLKWCFPLELPDLTGEGTDRIHFHCVAVFASLCAQ
jgi:hypothetical protein